MSGNNSTAPGYLTQLTSNVKGQVEITNLLQMTVVGITGLDPTLVRPRWQPQPPTEPTVTTNWCAIGIETFDLFDYPQQTYDSDGNFNLWRLVRINLLTSFYGPDASSLASQLRDGMYVNQNYNTLAQYGVRFRSAEDIIYISEIINSQYVPRVDLFLNFMHMNQRAYAVESLLGAQVNLTASDGETSNLTISQEN